MDLLLVILLIVSGYFAFFGWIMARSNARWSVSAILAVALLVYTPVICLVVVLRQYLTGIGLILYSVAVIYSVLYWICGIFFLIHKKTKIRFRVLLLLIAYLIAVFYITVFMREGGATNRVQMEVFHWLQNVQNTRHMLLNITLFLPVGLLFAVLFQNRTNVLWMSASFGLLISVLIETIQLVFKFGLCDIDDIITNYIGAVIGAGIVTVWNQKCNHV